MPNAQDPTPSKLPRMRFLWLIGVGVYLAALWYVGWENFWRSLVSVDPWRLAGVALVLLISLGVRLAKWRWVLGSGVCKTSDALSNESGGVAPARTSPPFKGGPSSSDSRDDAPSQVKGVQPFVLYFLSKAAGDVSPSRVGELSPLLIRRHRSPQVAAWIVADRLLEVAATLLFGAFGAVALQTHSQGLLPMLAIAAVLLVLLPVALLSRQAAFDWLVRRVRPGGIAHRGAAFLAESSREFVLLRGKAPVAAALTALATALDIVSGVLVYQAFGYGLSFPLLAAAQCLHGLVSAIPFLPNVTGAPYVAAAVWVNQAGGVPLEGIAATVTVYVLLVNTVFWSAFGLALWRAGETPAKRGSQADLFDRLAARDCLYRYAPEALAAVNALIADKGRVLDLGCGDGVLGAALDAPCVVGVDLSPRCARLSARKGLCTVIADAVTALPFAARAFDTIYCIDVLHHLGQAWDSVFAELDRVLRPGGALVIIEPDARNPLVRWTQAPRSPLRVAPYDNEPAIYPDALVPHVARRGYRVEVSGFQLDADQVVRDVFPLWQRLLKAPFVIALALWCRRLPNEFLITARKPD